MRLNPHTTELFLAFVLKSCSSSILTGEYFDISLVVVVVVVMVVAVMMMVVAAVVMVVVVAVLVVNSGDNQNNDGEAKTILDS
jgi:predicted branched-subunit amino acid permease